MGAASSPTTLHVVATAGHVDHGKSALVLRLTGMDPDRLAEEKRRGLTIDLGFAWCALPSGREIGFVDVPGHERFIRNMLAGVGPVRLVLFVVAADEGWKPQSEEHLEIVDVLGVNGAVVAMTKLDMVDEATLEKRVGEVRSRLSGTRLERAPIVPCSSVTGQGLDELRSALEAMLSEAPPPETSGRPRQFIDRVFTIKGTGTVVTGTLTGGPVSVGEEAEVWPTGYRARIRGLQTHKRSLESAQPISRVAVNLAGTPRAELARGDVLTLPGQWRPTSAFEARIRTVRGLAHPLTQRGAYKLYAGSAERDARLRIYGASEMSPGTQAYVRITLARPVVLDFKESFVLREAGRQETVAGGEVLDVDPPSGRTGSDPVPRLQARADSDRSSLARRLVEDRGAIRATDVFALTGARAADAVADGAIRIESWLVSPLVAQGVAARIAELLASYHAEHPLRPGLEIAEARVALTEHDLGVSDAGLADALLSNLVQSRLLVREGTTIRLPSHQLSTMGRADADRLVALVAAAEPTPPSVKELRAMGFAPDLLKAACAEGRLVQISPDILLTPGFVARAKLLIREIGKPPGVTVSAFREALGTSRKYALPILEYFDAEGLTRREGDYRLLRSD